jgi:two-component system, chemotaxis family, chemotaxis protein CheY
MAYSIMIVDDSETIRAVLERTFAMTKLSIDSIIQAANGKEALSKLETEWIDIIFSDINMPVMDGIKFVEALSSSPEYKHIPVVIVSTEGSSTRIDSLIKKGIKGYLRKPFTPEKIRDIIIETLGEWK